MTPHPPTTLDWLRIRGGTEAVVHLIRALTDANPDLALTKIDGIGAFDHVRRASMLEGLLRLPTAHRLLPYVRMHHGTPSHHVWIDDAALPHDIRQGEGGEQGDPLMPALVCLAMHGPLHESAMRPCDGEFVAAYLDDIYLLTPREAYNIVTETVWRRAGVRPNASKTECWAKGGGPAPRGVQELGAQGVGPRCGKAASHRANAVLRCSGPHSVPQNSFRRT